MDNIKKVAPVDGPNGVDRWSSNGYGLKLNGKDVIPIEEDTVNKSGMWYEKSDENWLLCSDKGESFVVEEDHGLEWIKSKEEKEELVKAKTYMKAKGVWDATAFGAGMTVFIADAVVKENDELKVLVFSTVRCAQMYLFKTFDRNFKRQCKRRIDEFYSKKEYQQRIIFENAGTEEWNDHILRPIVLLVNADGEIEKVVRHKELLKMAICPLLDAYYAVEFENKRFDVSFSLKLYEEQYECKE